MKSVGYAWKGLKISVQEQTNLRIHFLATVFVIVAGFYFRISSIEWCILLLMVTLVISLELVNSAIEELTNLVTREKNPWAGKIKDIAAAAVLVAAVASVIVGVIIFVPYIIAS